MTNSRRCASFEHERNWSDRRVPNAPSFLQWDRRRVWRSRRARRTTIVEARDQRLYLVVTRIGLEHALVPPACGWRVALLPGDVTEMTQRNQVLRIERERRLEHRARVVEPSVLVERLAVDDVPAHVTGLLRKELLAYQNRLIEITPFSELIGEGREITARILVELLLELVDAGGAGHQSLGGGAQAAVEGSGTRYVTW